MKTSKIENITSSHRVVRLVAGFGMVFSLTLQAGPVGTAAILPLLAIYPIVTGVIGWDPVVDVIAQRKRKAVKQLKGAVASAA